MEEHLKRLEDNAEIPAADYFVERFNLIHEYRKLPYFDPDLPEVLLPRNWLRSKAAEIFNQYRDILNDKAIKFFFSVLDKY